MPDAVGWAAPERKYYKHYGAQRRETRRTLLLASRWRWQGNALEATGGTGATSLGR